ncbi:MAG: ferrous iron transport protein B, partial [Desulfococcaceae bacterium]
MADAPEPLCVALAGNPNAGKTTLFNALTGARQSVGNYPGVTVEKREGVFSFEDRRITVVDLPGTYSLTAYSQEELVARNYLVQERPHVVVDVLDANSLERNLYLAVQFMEMGVPLVLALNMMDEVRRSGKRIDTARLSALLHVPIVETVARLGQGKSNLIRAAVEHALERNRSWQPLAISYGPDLDPALLDMAAAIEASGAFTDRYPVRWLALKFLEGDIEIREMISRTGDLGERLAEMVGRLEDHCLTTLDMTPESIIADYRYGFIASVTRQGVVTADDRGERIRFSDAIDRIVTHQFVGPALMVAVLYGMFVVTFTAGETPMGWLETAFAWLGDLAAGILPPGLARSLVVDGVIAGVGGVLGFVPLIMIMFMGVAFLEDSGYMARMAYMMDRVLRIFGLHGCSVMPFIVSGGIPGGCAVPGVMGARTLRSPKEKLATLLTVPFMPCGAKVPVFLLLGAAFFPGSAAAVLFWVTLGAWAMALLVAWVLRNTIIRGEATPFVMELPPYRLPTFKGLCIHTWERAWQYIKKAGTVILAISVLFWAAMTFPSLPNGREAAFSAEIREIEKRMAGADEQTRTVLAEELARIRGERSREALRHSVAGRIGTAIEPVTRPAGFDWQINIALIGGVAAKEVIVSTLGTAYALGGAEVPTTEGLSARLRRDPDWSARRAVSMIVFVMLYAPCFVTVVAMTRESSWKWAAFSVVYTTVLAYGLAVAVYQAGGWLAG